VLARHGFGAPTTVDELFEVSAALAKAGVTPIAVGSREPWTLALFVFESLLVAEQGATFYTDYLSGRLEPDDPKVVLVLEKAIDLFAFFNQDHARLSWLQAIELLIGGKAAMTVMGDWARVTLNASGMKLDTDYGEQAFPGTAATFVFTSDTFSVPVHAKNRAGARRLLETIGSREGQRALNLAKGSLPARGDVDIGGDAALRDKHERFQGGETALALSGLVPSQFAEDLGQALAEMAASHDPEPVVHTLRSRYALLR